MVKRFVDGIVRDLTAEEQAEYETRNTAWKDSKTDRQLEQIKEIRLDFLKETDWWVLRGNMTEAQSNYRQSMRDVPQNFDEEQYSELLARDEQGNLTHTIWEKP
jgi:hypothetical protein